MSVPPARAVTFDYWNTLVHTRHDPAQWRIQRWQQLLGAAGHHVPDELVRAVFEAEWAEHDAAWRRNEQYSGTRAARSAADRLGLPLDDRLVEDLVEAFATAGVADAYALCPGVAEVLAELGGRGIRIGIVCDVGFTPSVALRALLDGFGVLQHFAGWSFSDEVGWYKPAPEIFRHALDYLGVAAAECIHVGDLRRTDVAGAAAMGMRTVRYTAVHDDPTDGPEAHHVLDDHGDLLGLLDG